MIEKTALEHITRQEDEILSNKENQSSLPSEENNDENQTSIRVYKWRGSLYAIGSALSASSTSILIRKCRTFGSSEMAFLRYLIQLIIMVVIAIKNKHFIFGEKGQRLMLSLRGIFGALCMNSTYLAVALMDPSDATALFNCSIIFVTIFARIFLKEKLTLVHLIALAITILGVVFISKPTFLFGHMNLNQVNFSYSNSTKDATPLSNFEHATKLGISLSFFGAVLYATSYILLKKLSKKKAHTPIVLIYSSLYGIPASAIASAFLMLTNLDNRENTIYNSNFSDIKYEILLAFVSGFFGVSQQFLQNMALRLEDASKVSILTSTDLIFTFILQYIFLNIHSSLHNILGAFLILTGVLSIMAFKILDKKHSKHKKKKLLLANNCSSQNPKIETDKSVFKCLQDFFKRIFFFKF